MLLVYESFNSEIYTNNLRITVFPSKHCQKYMEQMAGSYIYLFSQNKMQQGHAGESEDNFYPTKTIKNNPHWGGIEPPAVILHEKTTFWELLHSAPWRCSVFAS